MSQLNNQINQLELDKQSIKQKLEKSISDVAELENQLADLNQVNDHYLFEYLVP